MFIRKKKGRFSGKEKKTLKVIVPAEGGLLPGERGAGGGPGREARKQDESDLSVARGHFKMMNPHKKGKSGGSCARKKGRGKGAFSRGGGLNFHSSKLGGKRDQKKGGGERYYNNLDIRATRCVRA